MKDLMISDDYKKDAENSEALVELIKEAGYTAVIPARKPLGSQIAVSLEIQDKVISIPVSSYERYIAIRHLYSQSNVGTVQLPYNKVLKAKHVRKIKEYCETIENKIIRDDKRKASTDSSAKLAKTLNSDKEIKGLFPEVHFEGTTSYSNRPQMVIEAKADKKIICRIVIGKDAATLDIWNMKDDLVGSTPQQWVEASNKIKEKVNTCSAIYLHVMRVHNS